MQRATFNLEKKLADDGYGFVIGIDEAGRGPLAGPVIASAVALRNFQFPRLPKPGTGGQAISNLAYRQAGFQINSNDQISNDKNWDLIRDSKTLSHKQREDIFDFIHENFHVGVGICDHGIVDRINILEATYLAAKKAIPDLFRKINQETRNNKQTNSKSQIANLKTIILFDGNKTIPNLSMEQKTVVNGDKTVKSISAASIVAKVMRDRIMLEMHQKYPQYRFDKHKGYGTKLHMEALQKYGPCEIHRRSFAPVKAVLF